MPDKDVEQELDDGAIESITTLREIVKSDVSSPKDRIAASSKLLEIKFKDKGQSPALNMSFNFTKEQASEMFEGIKEIAKNSEILVETSEEDQKE